MKPTTVDEYLARIPEPARTTLNTIRATIRSVVPPEATEAISYQIPTFKYKGSLVAYAAFRNHCSLFPMNSSLITTFKDQLKGYQTAKGTIRFPLDQPLPAALIKKIVKIRIADNDRKQNRK
ncbi:MAG: iron chaperone [Bryobacteraceae bacterium]